MAPEQKNSEISSPSPNEDLGEYSFHEPKYSTEYKATADETLSDRPGRTPFSKINKKVLIIIGIVLFLFILFRFLIPKKQTVPTVKKSQTTTEATRASQREILMSANVTSLQQQSATNSKNISELQSNVAQLQSTIKEMKNSLYNLNLATQKLSENVLHLVSSKRVTAHKKKPEILYHIRAIVSERAWLISDRGDIITVRPGTALKGYGKVTKIDPMKGVVKTSSGFEIHYGNKDI